MITVCKNGHTLRVTQGAFRNFYQKLGYKPLRSSKSVENPGEVNTHPKEENLGSEGLSGFEPDEDTSEEREAPLSEVPLSGMSHSQLLEYADQLGLDYEPTISKKDLKKMIRQHLG